MLSRNIKLTERNIEEKVSEEEVNHCPVCGVNGVIGGFCENHSTLIKDYEWIKNYINSLERFDNKTIHIIECAISERVSRVINDVPIVRGKLDIEEFLKENVEDRIDGRKEPKCTEWMERILREILALQKAKSFVIIHITEER